MDVYAFSRHVERFGEALIYSRMQQAMETIRGIVELYQFDSVHLFDSLFIVGFDGGFHGTECLHMLCHCIAEVQDELLDAKFISRGTLAHGNVELSPKVIVGAALIRAVRLEQQLGTPCVFLPLRELKTAPVPSNFIYDLPMKGGGFIRGVPILPRTMQLLESAHREHLDDSLVHGPAEAAQALTLMEGLIRAYAAHQRRSRATARRSSQEP
jgi:hypothetical protein